MAKSYEIPAIGTKGDTLLGWLLDALSEGEGWLVAQQPATEWDEVRKMLAPGGQEGKVEGLSNLGYNLVERNARDIVASLSDFRHDGEFKPRFDKSLYDRAHVLTKLDRNWYAETRAHEAFRAHLQNTVVFGTGYLYEVWNKSFHGNYGDIELTAPSPSDVMFVQLPKNHDIQQAYMVIVREELPLNLARSRYPSIAHMMQADRDAPGWIQKGKQFAQRLMGGSPALRLAGTSAGNQTATYPTVDIFTSYIMDRSFNRAPNAVQMGTHGTNWSYMVPALGSPIGMGVPNPSTGGEMTRPAEEDDCRLFPLRRMAIFTRTAIAYDGSSPWWHGKVPLARTRFNDWAWEALGKSLLGDPKTMQDGIIALMRGIEDAFAARLDPPYLYDENLVSTGFADNFDPRMAGARAAANLNAGGDIVKFPVDSSHYDVPQSIPNYIKEQEERIGKFMGTPDLVAMAKAKQVPGEGTLEKLLEMAGPLVKDMMRAIEVPMQQLGEWRKAYYFQFYTKGRIVQTTGPDDLPGEDYEYTPDQIVPYVENEPLAQKIDRQRNSITAFKYVVNESGVNEMKRMVNRLALLQLRKAGLPIDWWTIGKAFNLSNLGPEPEGTHNMMERWVAEQHLTRELAEELGGGQPGQGPGRPPSNKKGPQLVTKDGGARQTVKTS
jgi:hypothetical protein